MGAQWASVFRVNCKTTIHCSFWLSKWNVFWIWDARIILFVCFICFNIVVDMHNCVLLQVFSAAILSFYFVCSFRFSRGSLVCICRIVVPLVKMHSHAVTLVVCYMGDDSGMICFFGRYCLQSRAQHNSDFLSPPRPHDENTTADYTYVQFCRPACKGMFCLFGRVCIKSTRDENWTFVDLAQQVVVFSRRTTRSWGTVWGRRT